MSIARCAATTSDELVIAMQNLSLEPSSFSSISRYLTRQDFLQTAQVSRAWRQVSLKEFNLFRHAQARIFREIVSFACAWSIRTPTASLNEIDRKMSVLEKGNFSSLLDIEELFVRITRSCAAVLDISGEGQAFRSSLKNEIDRRVSNQETDLESSDQKVFRTICPMISKNFTTMDQRNWFFTFAEHHKGRSITRRLGLIRSDWREIGCENMAQVDIDQTTLTIFNEMIAKKAKPISFQRFIYSLCQAGEIIHALDVAKTLSDPDALEESVQIITDTLMRYYTIEDAEELVREFGGIHTPLYQRALFEQYCANFRISDPDDICSLLNRIHPPEHATGLCMVKALLTRANAYDIEAAEDIASSIGMEPERTEALKLICETMCDNLEVTSARRVVRKISDKETVQHLTPQIQDASICVRERRKQYSQKT
jgi:hypothetical protein